MIFRWSGSSCRRPNRGLQCWRVSSQCVRLLERLQVTFEFLSNRAVGSIIGKGMSDFITDWDKVSATVRLEEGIAF